MDELIKKAREALGTALESAKAISAKMREEPEKSSEHKEAFDKAMVDVKKNQIELQTLLEQKELATQYEAHHAAREQDRTPAGPPPRSGQTREQQMAERSERHRASFLAYMRYGEDAARECLREASPQERNALLGTQADLGGFLIPDDFRAELLRNLAGLAAFRMAGARSVPTGQRMLTFPTIKGGTNPYPTNLTAGNSQTSTNWKGEGATTGGTAPATQDKPTFGQENIPVHLWQPDVIELTRELLDDSVVPLDSILAGLLAETLALDEDWAFTLGDGVGKPEGLLNAAIGNTGSGAKGAVAYGTLVDWWYDIPAQYRQNATIMMNSDIQGKLLALDSSTNNLIFPPGFTPGTLFNRPVVFNEFMAVAGDGAVAIVAGNFSNYIIAERQDMRIQRLVERYAPNVGILPTARIGGQAVRTAAFRKYTLGS